MLPHHHHHHLSIPNLDPINFLSAVYEAGGRWQTLTSEAVIKACVSVTHQWEYEVIQLLSGKQKELWHTTLVCARATNV